MPACMSGQNDIFDSHCLDHDSLVLGSRFYHNNAVSVPLIQIKLPVHLRSDISLFPILCSYLDPFI